MRTLVGQCSTLPIESPKQEFRIIPNGLFSATDGRPHGLPGWFLSRDVALSIVQFANARSGDFVIDYEHQTINAKKNGLPNPAAGWFKRLEWREGDGLYVTDARWTDRAAAMILAKEYRFVSPTFYYNNAGHVLELINIGLTNTPALDGLTDLAAMAINYHQQEISRKDSEHSIESFNRVFSGVGVFHPDTSRQMIAELSGNAPAAKPSLPATMSQRDKEIMHLYFPSVF